MLRCLLLARGPEWVAVDLSSGALLRSRASGWPVAPADSALARGGTGRTAAAGSPGPELAVIEIQIAEDDEPTDPSRPDAVMIAAAPRLVGPARRGAVRQVLADLLPADPRRPLLDTLGPSISYEDLDGSRPSVAVVAPDRIPVFGWDASGTWCQFTLGGRKHRLRVADERIVEAAGRTRDSGSGGESIEAVIGGTPRYLVVALGVPRRGQVPKVVLGVLPRP